MQIYEKILKHTKNLTFNNQNPSPTRLATASNATPLPRWSKWPNAQIVNPLIATCTIQSNLIRT